MVVPISSKNPDNYQWGKNCKELGYSVIFCQDMLNKWFVHNDEETKMAIDDFWIGYNSIDTPVIEQGEQK